MAIDIRTLEERYISSCRRHRVLPNSAILDVLFKVRKKLVKDLLPVLIVCKDNNASPLTPSNKPLYLDLEETFLRIISTLPMPDAQELLQQCLSFSTQNVDDCPHLVKAFNTWFCRATHPPGTKSLLERLGVCLLFIDELVLPYSLALWIFRLSSGIVQGLEGG